MTKKQKNPFYGKWIVLRQECKAVDGTWFVFKRFRPTQLIWTFTRNPDFLRDGYLEQLAHGQEYRPDEFVYNAGTAELIVDASFYDTDDYMLECGETRYRVVKRSRSVLILYVLNDVQTEPDDYHERFVIRKYSLPAIVWQSIRCIPVRA